MVCRERGRQNEQTELEMKRKEGRHKEHKTKYRQTHLEKTHTHREQREGQGRINGCALIDKLIKQTKTHVKILTECKADTHLNKPN